MLRGAHNGHRVDGARVCEVVGIFHTTDDLESAVEELLALVSTGGAQVPASEAAVAEKLGGHYRPTRRWPTIRGAAHCFCLDAASAMPRAA